MRIRFLPVCTLLITLLAGNSCTNPPKTNRTLDEISLLPLPESVVPQKGEFQITDGMTIGYSDPSLKPAADYLASIMSKSTGFTFSVKEGPGSIYMELTNDAAAKENGYKLDVTSKKTTISSKSYKGIISGIGTFRQLLPVEIEQASAVTNKSWYIPNVSVTDSPRFEWRGLMLDVSRHFYSPDEVKELLDLMALYKLNKFHWHLTDDQGWRIEIKKYPFLTEKGAWRTFNAHDRECMRRAKAEDNPDYKIPEDKLRIVQGDTLYGGFYTQEDIKDIVAYAAVRGIDILPEIDMPGHMLAAVSNYQGVSCFTNTGWGKLFSSPVCPGKESALQFCKNVYSEVIPLFPFKYIHLGADEVDKANWKKCPDCQQRMREEGLATEEELQAWFVHYMEKFFNKHGRNLIGWDEILEGGLSETATIMWWRNWHPQSLPQATAQGNHAIYCPNANFYLDAKEDQKSIRNIFDYTLSPDSLNESQRKLILGVQGNIWCEWIPSRERMQYMAFPRILAIAEKAWSKPELLIWDDFQKRMIGQFERLGSLNVNYKMPDLEGFHAINAFVGEKVVNFHCSDPSVEIRYTTDGSIPNLKSAAYTGPIKIAESTDFTIRTFRSNGEKGDIFTTHYIKQELSPAVADVSPEKNGLKAVWHETRVDSCAEIAKTPVKAEYEINDVEIPEGVKGDIALTITGYINVPADGVYTFYLFSDDGSTLEIDSELVIDNDGPHAPKEVSGQRALAKGLHPIKIQYFDFNGGLLKLRIFDPDRREMKPSTGIYAH